MSLHTRMSFLLTTLAAVLLTALGGLWLAQARQSIHEEVEAATRVAEQWLTVSAREVYTRAPGWDSRRLLEQVRAIGRIRSNSLEVLDAGGVRRYQSPESTYKAGRSAPDWFSRLVSPDFSPRRIEAGDVTLVLHPDASRATLDTWDDLVVMATWAGVLLAGLFFAVRRSLDRGLRPLHQVMAALNHTGRGSFDTRLPVFLEPELGRLANAFNGMADRLAQAVNENVRLGIEREMSARLQARIEDERRSIARDLHDELAQGITAVRALAGAIAQRSTDMPTLHGPAQSIVAVTGQMQDGVRDILQRLRPQQGKEALDTDERLRRYLQIWQQHYPEIALTATLAAGNAPLSDDLLRTLLRIVQEGLTNVARHASATSVEVMLRRQQLGEERWLELIIADNGRGLCAPSSKAGCGVGLAGMRERVAALGGELQFDTADGGGTRLSVRVPTTHVASVEE